MSSRAFVSPVTRFDALDRKATKRPSALIAACWLTRFPWASVSERLASSVAPVVRSCTNTSGCPFVSPGTNVVECD